MLMVAWGSQVSLSGCNQLCTLPMVHCCLSLLQAVCHVEWSSVTCSLGPAALRWAGPAASNSAANGPLLYAQKSCPLCAAL